MDLAAIENHIRASGAGAIVVDSRLLRRVIKRHKDLPGLGLQVPHASSYTLRKADLLALIEPKDLGENPDNLPDHIVLLARPRPDELLGRDAPEILTRLWRAAFHGHVHLAVEKRIAEGSLDAAALRERIDRIGQIEFDEIRSILRHDDLLVPPHGDAEVYAEFAALHLELSLFAPDLLDQLFPSLRDTSRAEDVLAEDVPDARALCERLRPEGAPPLTTVARASKKKDATMPTYSSLPTLGSLSGPATKDPRKINIARATNTADALRKDGNVVGAALLRAAALASAPPDLKMRLRAALRSDLDVLSERLAEALKPVAEGATKGTEVEWTSLLLMVAEEAGPKRGLRYPIEARFLYDLQAACIASERPIRAVDLVTWALSFGKRPIVRPLPSTREVRIAREIRNAAEKIRHIHLEPADRKLLGRILRWAKARAEQNVRDALRPKIIAILNEVGLRPSSIPEEIARDKVVEELLDQATDRGFFGIGHLRDAISRNQLKLEDVSGPRELLVGDPLLLADKKLSIGVDGVYRRGEIYLRELQRSSSLAFGTAVGRALTLYLALPIVGAVVVLEGISHMASPISKRMGLGRVDLATTQSLLITAVVLLGVLHSEPLRALFMRAASLTGRILAAVLFRLPRWLIHLPAVRAFARSRPVRMFVRYGVVPGFIAALVYFVSPLRTLHPILGVGGAAAIHVGFALLLSARVTILLEEVFLDWLVLQWRMLRSRVLPGLVRLILDIFKTLLELFERGIYKVDEWLRFRKGELAITLGFKAIIGLVWFLVAYVVRLYVVLLIEPQVNPIKHFPVVFVADKILISFMPPVLTALQNVLSPLGSVVANAIAGPTVFLMSGVFGFLAWELMANYRLYRANRSSVLEPSLIGHHGETMGALMKPGLHSGTLPKLYARLRKAARRSEGQQTSTIATIITSSPKVGQSGKQRAERALRGFQDELRDVEEAVKRFVERELSALLVASPRFPYDRVEVRSVELGSNRVRITLECASASPEHCEIAFEEQSGFLVASVPKAGFLDALKDTEPPPGETRGERAEARLLFENALAGLYKLAGVDLVREQIEAALGARAPYDIADEGLILWPGEGYKTEVVYDLDEDAGDVLSPIVRGDPPPTPLPELVARHIFFQRQPISWRAWLSAWSTGLPSLAPTPRLIQGASILPPPFRSTSS
jgi:hypothetical protein